MVRLRTFYAVHLCLLVLHVCACAAQFQNFVRNFRRLFETSSDFSAHDSGDFLREYDFVVIGAGSGGSVVSNRLTENPNWNILLLEAGKDEIFLTDIPLTASLMSITGYNWGYKSEKSKTSCLGLIDGKCNLARGKGLGGTSLINFLLYTRGNRHDFDEWGSLGNPGWFYDDVLPYFIKSENCSLCKDIDQEFHGKNGYLHIEHPGYESPFVKLFIKTGQDMGYKNNDPNGFYGTGFSRVQATMRHGIRCSAAGAFLKPVSDRSNLHISTRSRVTKILIDRNSKQVYGVEFLKNRKKYKVKVKKEVILSAGSINSPQLLMLSGVGPADHLKEKNIPVIVDLPGVGSNYQDHMAMSTIPFLVNESITVSDISVQNPKDIYNFLARGKGPYTIPGGAEALAFIRTKYAEYTQPTPDYPDIELVLGAGGLNGDVFGGFRSLLGIPQDFFKKVYAPIVGKPSFSIATVLMRPKSRGRVLLKDKNPLHWPIVLPNYFSEEQDLATMVEGIKTRYNTKLHTIPFPKCDHLRFASDEYWACAVRQVSTTLGHHVGTCKMGSTDDPFSVVNHELKVYGVKGLRVVDGSIMPNVVAGHTNAVIFMIGEKASDMIKQDWA